MYKKIIISLIFLSIPYIGLALEVRVNLLDSTYWENTNLEALELAIDKGHDVNAKDNFHSTPLFLAVLNNGAPELINCLIKNGAQIDPRSLENTTPLLEAARFSKFNTIEALILNGANVNVVDDKGNTPLILASLYNNDPRIIELLISKGANINAIDSEGETALIKASQKSNFPLIVDALLRNGANPDDTSVSGFNPFMRACRFNKNPEIIDVFLQNNANVRAKFNNHTPLDFAKDNPNIFESDAYWRLYEATPKLTVDINNKNLLN